VQICCFIPWTSDILTVIYDNDLLFVSIKFVYMEQRQSLFIHYYRSLFLVGLDRGGGTNRPLNALGGPWP